MATLTDKTSAYFQPAGYKDTSGTLLTPTFTQANTIIYGTAITKLAYGSGTIADGSAITHGLSTGLYGFINPQVSGVQATMKVSGTIFTAFVVTNLGTATTATVDWAVFGNA